MQPAAPSLKPLKKRRQTPGIKAGQNVGGNGTRAAKTNGPPGGTQDIAGPPPGSNPPGGNHGGPGPPRTGAPGGGTPGGGTPPGRFPAAPPSPPETGGTNTNQQGNASQQALANSIAKWSGYDPATGHRIPGGVPQSTRDFAKKNPAMLAALRLAKKAGSLGDDAGGPYK